MEALDGEHKQVTVLCGALAEAPTLAARLGPEAMYHLMRDVLALAQDTVQRYEGTLLQVSGEGFLALFGAPSGAGGSCPTGGAGGPRSAPASARAPRRSGGSRTAWRSAWGCTPGQWWWARWRTTPQRPYTAAGDTLHLATRLQQQAAPDTLLVSAATYALVQDEVQGEVGEPSPSMAPSTPVPVYAIRGLLRRRAGVPRRGARPLSRFVGRTQELALLHERLAQAVSGQGQVIGIAGRARAGQVPAARRIRPQSARAAGDVLRRPLPGLWQRHPVPAGARPAAAALGPPRRRAR